MANRNMRFFQSEVTQPDFLTAFVDEEIDVQEKTLLLLTFVGEEVIAFLRSYTGNAIPIDRRSVGSHPRQQPGMPRPEPITGERYTHPGGWGDITEDLMRKYKYRVDLVEGGWQLSIINTSDHAVFVEAMAGFFVVSGVMDPGGPVDVALRKVIKQYAPDWTVLGYSGIADSGAEFPGAVISSAQVLEPAE